MAVVPDQAQASGRHEPLRLEGDTGGPKVLGDSHMAGAEVVYPA